MIFLALFARELLVPIIWASSFKSVDFPVSAESSEEKAQRSPGPAHNVQEGGGVDAAPGVYCGAGGALAASQG